MNNISVIKSSESTYPDRLNKLHDPPKLLFCTGKIEPLYSSTVLSVVGSRKTTAYGRQVTAELIRGLRGTDTVIVSGLAFGIDSLAHRAALDNNLTTIAVMPGGLDRIYPASHQALAKEIIERGGALISEYPNGTRATKYHFPARNRIVAALADAVLVIEAAQKSGTLITAEHALDIGVSVLAVPGNITSSQSVGANRLLQMGAGVVDSADTLRAELNIENVEIPQHAPNVNNREQQMIIDNLKKSPMTATELCERTNIEPRELNKLLTTLELSSHISNHGGNVWSL